MPSEQNNPSFQLFLQELKLLCFLDGAVTLGLILLHVLGS